jgi:anti-sigma factor RsiW
MSCPEDETLMMLADGEVGATDRAAVESHVANCQTCRGLVEEMRSLSAIGRSSLRSIRVPPARADSSSMTAASTGGSRSSRGIVSSAGIFRRRRRFAPAATRVRIVYIQVNSDDPPRKELYDCIARITVTCTTSTSSADQQSTRAERASAG